MFSMTFATGPPQRQRPLTRLCIPLRLRGRVQPGTSPLPTVNAGRLRHGSPRRRKAYRSTAGFDLRVCPQSFQSTRAPVTALMRTSVRGTTSTTSNPTMRRPERTSTSSR